jgi:hypothetical protein
MRLAENIDTMSHKKILLLSAVLMLHGCAGNSARSDAVPAWSATGKMAETAMPLMSGTWQFDPLTSDNAQRLIEEKIQDPNRLRRREMRRGNNSRNDTKSNTDKDIIDKKNLEISNPLTDTRLPVLHATTLKIEQSARQLLFAYDVALPLRYFSDGQPVSYDGNINIMLAEWEDGQFVIEKNGPRGRIVERWTVSPDRDRLHVQIDIQLPLLPEKISINRQFRRQP